jgi:hypothetical protein
MARGRLIVAGVILSIVAVVSARSSSAAPEMPPGVRPEMWRSLSPEVGIVLRSDRVPGHQGPVFGTLMVREGNRWRTVELMPGAPGAVPAQ